MSQYPQHITPVKSWNSAKVPQITHWGVTELISFGSVLRGKGLNWAALLKGLTGYSLLYNQANVPTILIFKILLIFVFSNGVYQFDYLFFFLHKMFAVS